MKTAHNPIVLQSIGSPGPTPQPADSDLRHRLARLGSVVIRLEAVPEQLASQLCGHVETLGGAAEVERTDGGCRLYLGLRTSAARAFGDEFGSGSDGLAALAAEIRSALDCYERSSFVFRCGDRQVACGARPLVMGIVNCTPDSFYGDSTAAGQAAVDIALRMADEGADLIDVGGESTRPGSQPVGVAEEIARVEPVIARLARRLQLPISIDTMKSEVAEAALAAGATIVNDVTGLANDPRLGSVIRQHDAGVVLMHTRGSSDRMYAEADYDDVVADVVRELRAAVVRARDAGIALDRIVVDPGIGFAKRAEHSLAILNNLSAFRSLGLPLLVGTSRKSFIGAVLDLPAEERLEGTAASVAAAVLAGAHIVRVHDVGPMRRVADLAAAIRAEGTGWIS